MKRQPQASAQALMLSYAPSARAFAHCVSLGLVPPQFPWPDVTDGFLPKQDFELFLVRDSLEGAVEAAWRRVRGNDIYRQ